MSNKLPRIVSAAMAAPGIVDLAWDDGTSCALDLSGELPAGVGNPRLEDWGCSLVFDGTDMDFSSPDLFKRAAWQDGRALRPDAFRDWRKKAGLTQEQLAALFDLSRRTIIWITADLQICRRIDCDNGLLNGSSARTAFMSKRRMEKRKHKLPHFFLSHSRRGHSKILPVMPKMEPCNVKPRLTGHSGPSGLGMSQII